MHIKQHAGITMQRKTEKLLAFQTVVFVYVTEVPCSSLTEPKNPNS